MDGKAVGVEVGKAMWKRKSLVEVLQKVTRSIMFSTRLEARATKEAFTLLGQARKVKRMVSTFQESAPSLIKDMAWTCRA